MFRIGGSLLAFALSLAAAPLPAQPPAGPAAPGVDARRIDAAVDRAGDFLTAKLREGKFSAWLWGGKTSADPRAEELVLYTLLYCGVAKKDPDFAKALARVANKDLHDVYSTAVLAMLLSELDRARFQSRIALCAQFLVDAQCDNGQWDYGGPGVVTPDFDPAAPAPVDPPAAGRSTRALKPVVIHRGKTGPVSGNNSTTQVALLGLRACLEANVRIPNATLAAAEQWWRKSQNQDGGWGYSEKDGGGGSYGSMTAGAVGSLALCDFYLGRDVRQDRDALRGAKWFEEPSHWTFDQNPRHSPYYQYYWFYALERAGVLLRADRIAGRDWYREGAEWLLSHQVADGHWNQPQWVEDTCYAVLFLRRATRPLTKIYSGQ